MSESKRVPMDEATALATSMLSLISKRMVWAGANADEQDTSRKNAVYAFATALVGAVQFEGLKDRRYEITPREVNDNE